MKNSIFIQSNSKQYFGALIAKYAIERFSGNDLPVHIIKVEELPEFQEFVGITYKKQGHAHRYSFEDLQSFTLTRFKPPELLNYSGQALVIDPDIFALKDIRPVFSLLRNNIGVACCRKKGVPDTSVMLLNCSLLHHWSTVRILDALRTGTDYTHFSTLAFETAEIGVLDRVWNSLDKIHPETMMLHTTNRLTQPWKTGLRIDFTRTPLPKLLGIMPREWIHRILGRYPYTYQPHPDPEVERAFFAIVNEAIDAGAIPLESIDSEILKGNIRKDFKACLTKYR